MLFGKPKISYPDPVSKNIWGEKKIHTAAVSLLIDDSSPFSGYICDFILKGQYIYHFKQLTWLVSLWL